MADGRTHSKVAILACNCVYMHVQTLIMFQTRGRPLFFCRSCFHPVINIFSQAVEPNSWSSRSRRSLLYMVPRCCVLRPIFELKREHIATGRVLTSPRNEQYPSVANWSILHSRWRSFPVQSKSMLHSQHIFLYLLVIKVMSNFKPAL